MLKISQEITVISFYRTYTTKPKSKTGSSHHKHKRKGRQPANPGQPKEKKKSTWAAINEKNYLCNLCGKTLKGLTAYKRHQVLLASTLSIWNKIIADPHPKI